MVYKHYEINMSIFYLIIIFVFLAFISEQKLMLKYTVK